MWLKDIQQGEGGAVRAFEKVLAELCALKSGVFVSFDLDSICGADAPVCFSICVFVITCSKGVSCASPIGLSASDALQIAMIAGRCEQVALFDLSELNPGIDDYRTGRLVAAMFYHFCMGVAMRKPRT